MALMGRTLVLCGIGMSKSVVLGMHYTLYAKEPRLRVYAGTRRLVTTTIYGLPRTTLTGHRTSNMIYQTHRQMTFDRVLDHTSGEGRARGTDTRTPIRLLDVKSVLAGSA